MTLNIGSYSNDGLNESSANDYLQFEINDNLGDTISVKVSADDKNLGYKLFRLHKLIDRDGVKSVTVKRVEGGVVTNERNISKADLNEDTLKKEINVASKTLGLHVVNSRDEIKEIEGSGEEKRKDAYAEITKIFTEVQRKFPLLPIENKKIQLLCDAMIMDVALLAYSSGNETSKEVSVGLLKRVFGVDQEQAKILLDYWVQNLLPDSTSPFISMFGLSTEDSHKFQNAEREMLYNLLPALDDPSNVESGWKEESKLWFFMFRFFFSTTGYAASIISNYPDMNVEATKMVESLKPLIAENPNKRESFDYLMSQLKNNFSSMGPLFSLMKGELSAHGDTELARTFTILGSTEQGRDFVSTLMDRVPEVRGICSGKAGEQVGVVGQEMVDYWNRNPSEFHANLKFLNDRPELLKTATRAVDGMSADQETAKNVVSTLYNISRHNPDFTGDFVSFVREIASEVDPETLDRMVAFGLSESIKRPRQFISRKLADISENPEVSKKAVEFFYNHREQIIRGVKDVRNARVQPESIQRGIERTFHPIGNENIDEDAREYSDAMRASRAPDKVQHKAEKTNEGTKPPSRPPYGLVPLLFSGRRRYYNKRDWTWKR